MTDDNIFIRRVLYIDNNLAAQCGRIVGEFMHTDRAFGNFIQHDVNIMQCPMFVAEIGVGNICGFVMGDTRTENAKCGKIAHLYVAANMHHRGIGTRLLSQIENLMRDSGIRNISVASRPWAVPFYMARGYVRDAVQKNFLQKSL